MKKTVLITGICGGIGATIGKKFSENNWDVVGLDVEDIEKGFDYTFLHCDVSKKKDIEKAAKILRKNGVRLNSIINNAAIQIEKKLIDTNIDEWNNVIHTNLTAIYLTTKHFWPFFNKEKSSIVNIASVHAHATSEGMAAYVASKGGITALTRAMSLELAPQNVRVNTVSPGAIDTAMLKKGLQRAEKPRLAHKKLKNSAPLNRIGKTKDVANLVYFLCDEEMAENITGQEFITDSGALAKLATE